VATGIRWRPAERSAKVFNDMDVRLPNLGEGVDSGSVVTLFVKEGDVIEQGQTILELENEKAVAPIPSPAQGRVGAIRVKPGDKLNVGQVILTLSQPGAETKPASAPAEPAPAKAAPAPAARPTPAGVSGEDGPVADELEPPILTEIRPGVPPPASPSIRRLAKDLGIDLGRVRGSQAGGRIVLQDLRAYVQRLQQIAAQQRKVQPSKAPAEQLDFSKWGPVSIKPLSSLRQVIGRRMLESWTTIPHVTQFDEADITLVSDLRKKHAPAYEKKGVRLTLTSFVLKALAGLLRKHPLFNASLDEATQNIVYKEYYHVGLAVDTESGLVVPVVRDVDTKSMLELSRNVQDVAEQARGRKLSLEDMRGGCFTISNQGGIGGAHFTPIINKPEVAILGLGRGALQPAVKDNQVVPRMRLPLALSYDHRLIDGANAARFMVDLVASLEAFKEEDLKL
jgi:pyruvate dehydrogenase E2 component (dihydrolipoamide acetyltransferase)